MALQHLWKTGAAVAVVAGLGAVVAGCSTQSAPMALACEPNQRAIVRQVVVNGAAQPQLECQSGAPAAASGAAAAAPVAYAPAAVPVGYSPAPIAETQFVRTAYEPAVVRRTAAPQRVVYEPAPRRVVSVRPRRSIAKSAIIIGSSAGIGAGVGAAIGGKKGAGIGALLGGGGAALWDQITRHR